MTCNPRLPPFLKQHSKSFTIPFLRLEERGESCRKNCAEPEGRCLQAVSAQRTDLQLFSLAATCRRIFFGQGLAEQMQVMQPNQPVSAVGEMPGPMKAGKEQRVSFAQCPGVFS